MKPLIGITPSYDREKARFQLNADYMQAVLRAGAVPVILPVTDDEAVEAFEVLSRTEGIIPAIESAHAVAYAMKLAPTMPKDAVIVINISGRGDKDVAQIARYRGEALYE